MSPQSVAPAVERVGGRRRDAEAIARRLTGSLLAQCPMPRRAIGLPLAHARLPGGARARATAARRRTDAARGAAKPPANADLPPPVPEQAGARAPAASADPGLNDGVRTLPAYRRPRPEYAAPGAPAGGRAMAPDAVLAASVYLGPDPHRALGCEHERMRCLLTERVYGAA